MQAQGDMAEGGCVLIGTPVAKRVTVGKKVRQHYIVYSTTHECM